MQNADARTASDYPEPTLRTAIVGIVALTPAVLFAITNVLRWELDVRSVGVLAGPFVNGGSGARSLFEIWALLGPVVALLVTLPDTVSIRRARGSTFGVEIRVASSVLHVTVILASIVVLALFAGYFASEELFTPTFSPSAD